MQRKMPANRSGGWRVRGAQARISRRRFLLGSAGLFTGAWLLSACGSPDATQRGSGEAARIAEPGPVGELPDRVVEIEYWHRQQGDTEETLRRLAERFNREHEGRVRVTSIYQGDIDELNQKVRAAAQGGGLPGALMADDYDVTQYALGGILAPLDSYMDHEEYGLTQEERADFLSAELERHKLPIYDGNTMAFPQGYSAFACYWNLDALGRAGFDGPPATWEEFPDHLRAVSEANGGSVAWSEVNPGSRMFAILITQDIDWLKEGGRESNFDAPQVLDTLRWWKELRDEGVVEFPSGDVDNEGAFASGQSAYFMGSSAYTAWLPDLIDGFEWTAGLSPQGRGVSPPITEKSGPTNTIPATDPESQLAGWLWVKWLTGVAPQAELNTAISYFPSTRSALESTEFERYYAQNPVAAKLQEEVAPYARIPTPSPAQTQVRGEIVPDVVSQIMLERLSPEEGAERLKAETDAAIREANESFA